MNPIIIIITAGILLIFNPQILILPGILQESQSKAEIEITQGNGKISVKGYYYNGKSKEKEIFYILDLYKKSKSGNSKSTQSGKKIVPPKQKVLLSKVGLNIDNNLKCKVFLKVLNQQYEVIAVDSVFYGY